MIIILFPCTYIVLLMCVCHLDYNEDLPEGCVTEDSDGNWGLIGEMCWLKLKLKLFTFNHVNSFCIYGTLS